MLLGFYDYTVWLTYGSLISAITGIFLGLNGKPFPSCLCLIICGLLDAFDGKVARTKRNRTDTEKRFGIQLDSLSDLVAFGILPGALGFSLGCYQMEDCPLKWIYGVMAALFALAALIRLAHFNVMEEERQSKTHENRTCFAGVPVTSSASIFPGLVILASFVGKGVAMTAIYMAAMAITGTLFLMAKLQVPKPKLRGLIILVVLGVVEFVALMLCAGGL